MKLCPRHSWSSRTRTINLSFSSRHCCPRPVPLTIQIHNDSSDMHKKPVVTRRRTRQSLEGVRLTDSAPNTWAGDLSNARHSDSRLLSAMVPCAALPCLIKCLPHMTVIRDRDFQVLKSPAWSASQDPSRTPGKVCDSITIDPTGRALK